MVIFIIILVSYFHHRRNMGTQRSVSLLGSGRFAVGRRVILA